MTKAQPEDAYKLWYEFLKRSAPYMACCATGGAGELAALYVEFGDVREPWERWWQGHRYLFEDVEPDFVVNVVPGDQAADPDCDGDLLVLLVNLHRPQRTIMRELSGLIREHKRDFLEKENSELTATNPYAKRRSTKGAPPRDNSRYHRYGLRYLSKPAIASLRLTLDVYDACLREDGRPKDERKHRYEIAEDLKICQKITIDSLGKKDLDEVNSASAAVSRYYKEAKNIINHVEKGIFPDRSAISTRTASVVVYR